MVMKRRIKPANGVIDLTGDAEFEAALVRRSALREIEKAGDEAAAARRIVDQQIIAKMGNAAAALAGATRVTTFTVMRDAYVVPAYQYRRIVIKGESRLRGTIGSRRLMVDAP
jgi:hypothetical protein